ncbi:intercellular adhesion molecule 4 [Pelodytes ibericus]
MVAGVATITGPNTTEVRKLYHIYILLERHTGSDTAQSLIMVVVTLLLLNLLIVSGALANPCSVTLWPETVAARFGDTVILNCTTNCTDVQTLNWKTQALKVLDNGPQWVSLTISNYDRWEAPSICFAITKTGLIQATANVTFYTLFPPLIRVKENISDQEDVWILCNVSSVVAGGPPSDLTVTLSSTGQILNSSRGDSVVYKLRAGAEHHKMEVWCEAQLGVHRRKFSERSSQILNVLYGPTHVSVTSDRTAFKVGEYFTVNCSGDANPTGKYLWTVPNNGSVIFASDNSSLVVHGTSEKDSGKYECTLYNGMGRNQSHIVILFSKEKPWNLTWLIVVAAGLTVIALAILGYAKRRTFTECLSGCTKK